ncbi:hypothetical protein JN11_00730 [Mucilaginibacter frigoritolerans]|jgi:hypothetical protein|uniref:Uncharacterized protein n=1 Tax=Mucilaginibacter frigoritolerans TaxID=652788 RepID=A0A562UBM5_9SPHI|nr:hypothetical protein [Mucilaginibacter frigoritolerans]TWJ03193.1 hypothetical protein JN11_00730 [Mucilaginibacter frigoritolerans]
MKKATLINLMAVILIVIATKANAQTQTNYYIGKWDVLVKGLPNGDTHMKFNIADSAGHTKGVLLDTTAAHKDIPLTKIEQDGDKITLYFNAQGYDVSLLLAKKDDDHATGSLMGMFDANAIRMKEK